MVVGKVRRWCSARLHLVKLYLPYTWRDQVLCVRERGGGGVSSSCRAGASHISSVWIAYSRYAVANSDLRVFKTELIQKKSKIDLKN